MNILPKKSWHVRNKDNVAKVRRDEEKARLEEKEQGRRAALAEQEARTNFLRQKAKSRLLDSGNSSVNEGSNDRRVAPVNFFSDSNLERGASSSLKNIEHEKEKKEEQINYERKIGLLTYLGESAADKKEEADKPWYYHVPDRVKRRKKNVEGNEQELEDAEKDLKRKSSMDPLHIVKEQVEKKKMSIAENENSNKPNSNKNSSEKKKHKHKSHKHKHKHRDMVDDHGASRSKGSDDNMKKLREERMQREKKEREKTMILLGLKSDKEKDDFQKDNPPERYNSQFNPHLVRKRHH